MHKNVIARLDGRVQGGAVTWTQLLREGPVMAQRKMSPLHKYPIRGVGLDPSLSRGSDGRPPKLGTPAGAPEMSTCGRLLAPFFNLRARVASKLMML